MRVERRYSAALVAAGGLLVLTAFIGMLQLQWAYGDKALEEGEFSLKKTVHLEIRGEDEPEPFAVKTVLAFEDSGAAEREEPRAYEMVQRAGRFDEYAVWSSPVRTACSCETLIDFVD